MVNEKYIVLTISDSCSAGTNADHSGPRLVECISSDFPTASVLNHILPDDENKIVNSLIYHCDVYKAHVILTTGGTGLSPRDVTPEATRKVVDRMTDGITIALMVESLKITPMAMTSRLVSGIRKNTLIINFPGSVKAVTECYGIIRHILSHSIDLLNNELEPVMATHRLIQSGEAKTGCKKKHLHCSKSGDKDRNSPYPMIEVGVAMKMILDSFNLNPDLFNVNLCDNKKVTSAVGYVIAIDVVAKSPFPPFDASIKDGYACLSEDGASDRIVRDEIAAGDDPSIVLKRGECVFINTGAPVPAGADCVVQIEDTKVIKRDGAREHTIGVSVAPVKGQDIRHVGSDIKMGEIIIPKGREIGPAEIGLLASSGKTKVKVFTKPSIGILSTGTELQPINTVDLKKGHIRDSNKSMLISLFKDFHCQDFGIIIDDPVEIKDALCRAFEVVDILITTGGVSMGDRDYLKPVLRNDFGANIVFGRLNMKPGKPTTFATLTYKKRTKYVFALPGNPVSALVTSQLMVLPVLKYLSGKTIYELIKLNVLLGERVELDPRPHYARACINHHPSHDFPVATLTGNQISSRLMNSSGANVLLVLPGSTDKQTHMDKFQMVEALLINT